MELKIRINCKAKIASIKLKRYFFLAHLFFTTEISSVYDMQLIFTSPLETYPGFIYARTNYICFFLFMLSTSKLSQNQLRKEGERKREKILSNIL